MTKADKKERLAAHKGAARMISKELFDILTETVIDIYKPAKGPMLAMLAIDIMSQLCCKTVDPFLSLTGDTRQIRDIPDNELEDAFVALMLVLLHRGSAKNWMQAFEWAAIDFKDRRGVESPRLKFFRETLEKIEQERNAKANMS